MENYLEFLTELWDLTKNDGDDGFKTWKPLIAKHKVNRSISVPLVELGWVVRNRVTGVYKMIGTKPTMVSAEYIHSVLKARAAKPKKINSEFKFDSNTTYIFGHTNGIGLALNAGEVKNNRSVSERFISEQIPKKELVTVHKKELEFSSGEKPYHKPLMNNEWIKEFVTDENTIDILTNAIKNPNIVETEVNDDISNIDTNKNVGIQKTENIKEAALTYTKENLEADVNNVLIAEIAEVIKNKEIAALNNILEGTKEKLAILEQLIETERNMDAERYNEVVSRNNELLNANVIINDNLKDVIKKLNTAEYDLREVIKKLNTAESDNEKLNIKLNDAEWKYADENLGLIAYTEQLQIELIDQKKSNEELNARLDSVSTRQDLLKTAADAVTVCNTKLEKEVEKYRNNTATIMDVLDGRKKEIEELHKELSLSKTELAKSHTELFNIKKTKTYRWFIK